MKSLPSALESHLQSGVTTLCWCWRIVRRDGERFGFTDHDCDLTFDGTVFEAATGFTATEIREAVGLSVDNLDVESALNSDHLSESALDSGDFDDAAIEIFRVNWSDPTARTLVRKGSLGEVRRTGFAFTAEVRGLAHYLQQSQGRVFQSACDADLGDRRCGVRLDQASVQGSGAVLAVVADRVFTTTGIGLFADAWFTRGLLTFASGANRGRSREVKRHAVVDGVASLELWEYPGSPILPGDTFILTAGCDKTLGTCRDKFANARNYRGFPHMPGNDFVASPIRRSSG
ncbi:MAG: DUF2163 domain-containing protein [Burkholderiales bacterium]